MSEVVVLDTGYVPGEGWTVRLLVDPVDSLDVGSPCRRAREVVEVPGRYRSEGVALRAGCVADERRRSAGETLF